MKLSTEDYVLGGIAAFLIAAVFMFGGAGGGKTPEDLAAKVFKAVQSKDADAAQKMTVTNADLLFMISKSPLPTEAMLKAKAELKGNKERMEAEFAKAWEGLIQRFEETKIDPKQMVMGTPVVEIQDGGGMLSKELKGARVEVPFTAAQDAWRLRFAAFQHGRWRLVSPIMLSLDTLH